VDNLHTISVYLKFDYMIVDMRRMVKRGLSLPSKQVVWVQVSFGDLILAFKASCTGLTPVWCPFCSLLLFIVQLTNRFFFGKESNRDYFLMTGKLFCTRNLDVPGVP
jgi:hypothetical protein